MGGRVGYEHGEKVRHRTEIGHRQDGIEEDKPFGDTETFLNNHKRTVHL